MTARARRGSDRAGRRGRRLGAIGERACVAEGGVSTSTPNSRSSSPLGATASHACLGLAAQNDHERRHPAPLDRAVRRRSSRRQVAEAREAARADRRGARPCRRADGRIFRQRATARSSTRWRRASTIAATGRSRARSPRSSRSISARSAACRWARPTLAAPRREMGNLIGDDVGRAGPRSSPTRPPTSTSTARARRARPQDGPRHPTARTLSPPVSRRGRLPDLVSAGRTTSIGRPSRSSCGRTRPRRRPPPRRNCSG